MIDNKEAKELFLNDIEGTADFRATKADQYDDLKNLVARDNLNSLYKYVEKIPESDLLFRLYKIPNEHIAEIISSHLKSYGYQETESPKEFIERLKKELSEREQ